MKVKNESKERMKERKKRVSKISGIRNDGIKENKREKEN